MKTLFLFRQTSILLFLFTLVSSHPVLGASKKLPILQGPTSSTETQFSIVAPSAINLSVTLKDDKNRPIGVTPKVTRTSNKRLKVDIWQFFYGGLSPNRQYSIELRNGQSQKSPPIDVRKFSTFPVSMKEPLRFVTGSCSAASYFEKAKGIYKEMEKLNPHFILLLGDNIYGDHDSQGEFTLYGKRYNFRDVLVKNEVQDVFWVKHLEMRTKHTLAYSEKLTPIFAIWDDHDYGMKDGDSTFVSKDITLKVHKLFFPSMKTSTYKPFDTGVGAIVKFDSQVFVLLDNRYFRTPNKKRLNSQSHFGNMQIEALYSEIEKADQMVWIVSGDQFFGNYHKWESFAGSHPSDFAKFKLRLKRSAKSLFAFIAGDRHHSALMSVPESRVGLETYEIISSPIHAKMFPGFLVRNPHKRILAGEDTKYNFTFVSSELKKNLLHLKAEGISYQGDTEYSRDLRIKRTQIGGKRVSF